MRRLIFFGVLIIFASCEPGNLVDLPTSTSRITILSFNQVGQPWVIMISPSAPSASGFTLRNVIPGGIPGATVSLYEDGNFLEALEYDTLSPDYMASVYRSATNSPRAGHHYKIVVQDEEFPTAIAEYTQPIPVPADITFDLFDRELKFFPHSYSSSTGTRLEYDTVTQWTFDISITFTDPPGDNYYDFWMEKASTEDSLGIQYLGEYLQKDGRPFSDFILDNQVMIDDKDISGDRVTFKFKYSVFNYKTPPPFEGPTPEWFRVSLRSMPEAQYRSIFQSRKSQLAEYDPYAQPITTFTNVENGLGAFGGYSPYSKTFYYKLE